MAFSVTPDITERIPALLSARAASADAAAVGVLYDVVVSGIGFVFAVDSQHPYLRESAQVQKQQIDTSSEAGEQTLDGSWVRSQTSWHLGAGAEYYEPGNRDETVPSKFRFRDSRGVNVWDRGKLSLLRAMSSATTTSGTVSVCGGRRSGEDVWWSFDTNGIHRYDSTGDHIIGAYDGFASSDYQIVNAGSVILAGGGFGIRAFNLATNTWSTLCSQALGPGCQPYWVKSRIITSRLNVLHQHSLAGGAIDATSQLFAHPDTGWTWTGVTETPDAILAAGHSGGQSIVYAFTLIEDSGGSIPKLSQPRAVLELPPGEEIRSIRSYLGTYVGIGTTAGIRVGLIGQSGQIQTGPVLVETSSPVSALAARDTFLYAAAGNSVIRVDLSESLDNGLRFPYAYDVEIPDGFSVNSLCFQGVTDRVVAGSNTHGTYVASTTSYVSSGWIESGDVRFGTTAPKAFRLFDVAAATPSGTTVAVAATVQDAVQPLVTLASGKSGSDVSLGSLPVPLSQLRYRLTLTGGSNTPLVDAVAVKAVPVPKKQRLVQYPVQLVDRGRDSKGTAYGHDGYASEVLMALEGLEDSRAIVSVKDLTRPEQFEATIEKVELERVEPRSRGTSQGNFGGVAKITVRTL